MGSPAVSPIAPGTATPDDLSNWVRKLWNPAFPRPDLVEAASALVPRVREASGPAQGLSEGPRWEVIISPGAVQVRTKDWSRADRTEQREEHRHRVTADALSTWVTRDGRFPYEPEPAREITGWSRKSRARMVLRLCEIDYAPLLADPGRIPAMLTLTYPGDWLTVAPNGKAAKRHLQALRKRYRRAWGEDLVAVWKLEFQGRGAPHFHLLTAPPTRTVRLDGRPVDFRTWVSAVWASIVDHPDPEQRRRHELAGTGVDWAEGLKATDPRRVAVYFTKHGSFSAKEYQHCVPEPWREPGQGPGRFWGYWVLSPARAGVHVRPRIGIVAGRTIRRWARAKGLTHRIAVERVEQATGRIRTRHSRVRTRRLAAGRGWVSVNDGPAFASQLARYLLIYGDTEIREGVSSRPGSGDETRRQIPTEPPGVMVRYGNTEISVPVDQ